MVKSLVKNHWFASGPISSTTAGQKQFCKLSSNKNYWRALLAIVYHSITETTEDFFSVDLKQHSLRKLLTLQICENKQLWGA